MMTMMTLAMMINNLICLCSHIDVIAMVLVYEDISLFITVFNCVSCKVSKTYLHLVFSPSGDKLSLES